MAKKKIVECGFMTGTGDTITEAKADLQRQLTAACTDSYRPILLTAGRYMAVVFREPTGWAYQMTFLDDVVESGMHEVGYGQSYDTKDAAIQMAAFHVLDVGGPLGGYRDDDDIPKMLTDPEKRRSLLSKGKFLRAYAYAKANKPDMTEHQWFGWAHAHSSQPEFA